LSERARARRLCAWSSAPSCVLNAQDDDDDDDAQHVITKYLGGDRSGKTHSTCFFFFFFFVNRRSDTDLVLIEEAMSKLSVNRRIGFFFFFFFFFLLIEEAMSKNKHRRHLHSGKLEWSSLFSRRVAPAAACALRAGVSRSACWWLRCWRSSRSLAPGG